MSALPKKRLYGRCRRQPSHSESDGEPVSSGTASPRSELEERLTHQDETQERRASREESVEDQLKNVQEGTEGTMVSDRELPAPVVVYRCPLCATTSESQTEMVLHVKERCPRKAGLNSALPTSPTVDRAPVPVPTPMRKPSVSMSSPRSVTSPTSPRLVIAEPPAASPSCTMITMSSRTSPIPVTPPGAVSPSTMGRSTASSPDWDDEESIEDDEPVPPEVMAEFAGREPPLNCEVCGKEFPIPARLLRHQRIHTGEKPFRCEFCGKTFSVKENLNVHRRIHTKERPYKCDVCGRAFEHSGKLNRHLRIHTGERPHKCHICSKAFVQSGQLVIHMRAHTGEKPYGCQTCGKAFTCSKQLKVHRRTHTGEKPYTCNICGKSFGYNHVLKTHKNSHYGQRMYKCTICSATFPQRKTLEQHLAEHNGEGVKQPASARVSRVSESSLPDIPEGLLRKSVSPERVEPPAKRPAPSAFAMTPARYLAAVTAASSDATPINVPAIPALTTLSTLTPLPAWYGYSSAGYRATTAPSAAPPALMTPHALRYCWVPTASVAAAAGVHPATVAAAAVAHPASVPAAVRSPVPDAIPISALTAAVHRPIPARPRSGSAGLTSSSSADSRDSPPVTRMSPPSPRSPRNPAQITSPLKRRATPPEHEMDSPNVDHRPVPQGVPHMAGLFPLQPVQDLSRRQIPHYASELSRQQANRDGAHQAHRNDSHYSPHDDKHLSFHATHVVHESAQPPSPSQLIPDDDFTSKITFILSNLIGAEGLKRLGYPHECGIGEVLERALLFCSEMPCTDNGVGKLEQLKCNMRTLLLWCIPDQEQWQSYGWQNKSIEDIVDQFYRECSRDVAGRRASLGSPDTALAANPLTAG